MPLLKILKILVLIIKDTTEFTLRGTLSQVEYNISKNLWLANVDKGQIGQVIQNLVFNASQAMNNKELSKYIRR